MTSTVELPIWLLVLIVLFAGVTFLSHFLVPSVRWFLRRRLERAVAKLNTRLTRPIEPFKLARRHDMIQRLIYDPEVTQAILEEARSNGLREDVAFQRARRFAREIVPSFSAFAYFGLGIRAARWLATRLYDVQTGSDNAKVIADIPEGATVVFVMNHRSNMDYVLVTYLAAQASALSYAVGEWARVWPLSRLIKSMGAYFIRRRSRGALYRKVLARYVQMATAGGVSQAVFPEGGLSLNGQLMPPKLGILTYVVSGHEVSGREVAFVPVAINYDRVLEDRILTAAHRRGDRRFAAKISVLTKFILRNLWLRLSGRFNRFGGARVVFGDATLLSSFEKPVETEVLGHTLMARIAALMPVLPVPVIAETVLEGPGVTKAEILARYRERAQVDDGTAQLETALQHMEQRHLIHCDGDTWSAVEAERDLLVYYANSILAPEQPEAAS